ncbi:hypothetical protein V5799_006364 [Amblyomma americanum]|uniref:Uncharacterized protein n=1 Tax=Amblyomma americanum TaxID=6943 RepID=A0AAQ4DWL6_AMBAM
MSGFDPVMSVDPGGKPHLDIDVWLQNLDLPQYSLLFCKYTGVEEILWMSERDVKDLGVKNGAHRAILVSSLIVLKRKYDKGNRVKSGGTLSSRFRSSSSLVQAKEKPPNLGGKTLSYPNVLVHSAVSPVSPLSLVRSCSTSTAASSHRSSMETPVTTETPAEDLKKALEWELGLDSRDLRSHAWYHGTIPRQRAEELMTADGFFLVRDCVSRPGDYVLTCCWKGAPLHFVINKVVLQPFTVYERVQYQFEDDCFDTVPDLVTFYVGNKRPISAASGAVVSRPVNRSMPLSYYAQRYGIEGPKAVESSQQRPLDTSSVVPAPSNGITSEPHLPQKMHSSSHASTGPMSSCATLPSRDSSSNHRRGFIRVGSDPLLSPTLERRALEHRPLSGTVSSEATQRNLEGSSEDQPPPKPSRVPSKRLQQKPVVVKRDPVPVTQYVNNCEGVYSELADNGGSSIMAETSDLAVRPGDIKRHAMPHRTFIRAGAVSTTQAASAQCSDAVACNRVVTVPEIDPPSSFDLVTFATTLLPSDNKPLDKSIMARVRNVLLESGPRALANHLTRLDLDVLGLKGERDLGLGVTVGLELLALPQGSRFRKDLLERTECIKLFVASTLLMCADDVERVELLNKWIQVAGDTKTALGNLYGFTGIMQGLAMSQVP